MNSLPIQTARGNQILNGLASAALAHVAADLQLREVRVRDSIVRRGKMGSPEDSSRALADHGALHASAPHPDIAVLGLQPDAPGGGSAGIITYLRGVITILDRARLEVRSCECYRMIRDEYARLLVPQNGAGP